MKSTIWLQYGGPPTGKTAGAELNHAGIATDGYRPGPYALEERLVEDFKEFYVETAKSALGEGAA